MGSLYSVSELRESIYVIELYKPDFLYTYDILINGRLEASGMESVLVFSQSSHHICITPLVVLRGGWGTPVTSPPKITMENQTSNSIPAKENPNKKLKRGNKFKDVQFCMSFLYMRNKMGPKMDPCGTPHVIDVYEDDLEYVSVYCLRFVK